MDTGYDRDPRVRRHGSGYRVTAPDGHYQVLHSGLGWAIYTTTPERNPDLVLTRRGPAAGYRNPAHAIHALIGDPQ